MSRTDKVIRIDPDRPDPGALERIVEVLKKGGVIAFPTETVYGLGGILSWSVKKRLSALKKRASGQPMGIFVHSKAQVRRLAERIPLYALKMIKQFWPGPVTLVLRSSHPSLKPVIHRRTAGFRIPRQMWLLQVLKRLNRPMLQTSANFSGRSPLRDPRQVLKQFDSRLDAVVSVGKLPKKKSSTVVDATGNFPIILRPGAISRSRILNIARRD